MRIIRYVCDFLIRFYDKIYCFFYCYFLKIFIDNKGYNVKEIQMSIHRNEPPMESKLTISTLNEKGVRVEQIFKGEEINKMLMDNLTYNGKDNL